MTQMMDAPANLPARTSGQGAIQRVDFRPLDPVGSPNALKALIESQRSGLSAMLPKHITPERLFKTLLVAANRNPDILKCTQASILETINRAAELGLDLSGTLGEAYPVPFNNKVKWRDDSGRDREDWRMQCSLIIGYRGLEKLAWQSGEVESIDAEVVYTNDTFRFKKGTEVVVEWEPCLTGDRGEPVGAYACLKMKAGGKLARFLTKSDIEKIRNASKSKESPAWRNWWDEMARKCALKRTLKDAPLSTEKFVQAMDHDTEDVSLEDVLAARTTSGGRTAGLLGRLQPPVTRRPVSEGQQFEADPDAERGFAAQAAGDGEIINRDTGEIDTSGAEAEPPAEERDRQQSAAPDLSSWPKTLAACEAAAQEAQLPPSEFTKRIGNWLKVLKLDKKPEQAMPAQRLELIQAIRDGRLNEDGKIVSKG